MRDKRLRDLDLDIRDKKDYVLRIGRDWGGN